MIKKYSRKALIVLSICLVFSVIFIYNTIQSSTPEKVFIHSSYTKNYENLEELVNSSDCIAIVEVNDNGTQIGYTPLPETIFTAEIKKPIFNCEKGDEIKLYMIAGKKDNVIYEKADDPLMKSGEKYLIFAKKNSDGTYTTLTGTQGRMEYKNGKISTLNVVNGQVKANSDSSIKIYNDSEEDMIEKISMIKEKKD